MFIKFIHVGKTGGTTIHELLRNKLTNYKELHLSKFYYNNEKYILWIRNPISRFVSAFNHSYYALSIDVSTIKSFDLQHCLMPGRMKSSIGKNYVFSEYYDGLMKCFTSANHLAESLTSEDLEMKQKAIELMTCEDEHLYKGLGWYLDNGNFIENNHNNILFVGTTENMKDCINKLSIKLGVNLDENLKLRENIYIDKSMKYLSPVAIKNIIDWYKDTDYATLQKLLEYEFITEEIFISYFIYNNE
jgi:hypothetical protein